MLRRFFAHYRPYTRLFALDFGCAILSGLMELGFPIAVTLFVDRLLPSGDWGVVLLAAVGLAARRLTRPTDVRSPRPAALARAPRTTLGASMTRPA